MIAEPNLTALTTEELAAWCAENPAHLPAQALLGSKRRLDEQAADRGARDASVPAEHARALAELQDKMDSGRARRDEDPTLAALRQTLRSQPLSAEQTLHLSANAQRLERAMRIGRLINSKR